MKVNLLLGTDDLRSGFVNVDPHAAADDPLRVMGDAFNLNHIADGNELEELVTNEALDYVPMPIADKVLSHWLSKIAHGGTITLSCVDLLEVSRHLQHRILSVDDANTLLFGTQKEPWQFKRGAYNLATLVETLQEHGFQILSKRVNDFRAYVTARRP